MKNKIRQSIGLLCTVIVLGTTLRATAQQDDDVIIAGPSSVCSDDDVQGYSAFFAGDVNIDENCLSYFWSVDGGTIVNGNGSRSIQVDWNRTGSLSVTISTEGLAGPDPDGGFGGGTNCPFFENQGTLIVNYLNASNATLTLSDYSDQELCVGESATITASVSDPRSFQGWFRNNETTAYTLDLQLNISNADLTESETVFTAKATSGLLTCAETLTHSITFINRELAGKGFTAGDASVYRDIGAEGSVTIYGDDLQVLDHWEKKTGSGDWEPIETPGGLLGEKPKVPINYGYSISYNQRFQETTRYRAILKSACGEGLTESDEIVITVLDYTADYNSVITTNLSETGEEVSKSAQYFDSRGRLLQSQSWDKATNDVMASEPIYDQYDRPVGQTLHAPTGQTEVGYKLGFFTAEGEPYTYEDFESLEEPNGVDKEQPKTLGWYYSNKNTDEPQMPETRYPFALSNFYEDGSGESKSSSMPGDFHTLESGRVGVQKSLPVFDDELDEYRAIRNMLLEETQELGRVVKRVSKDANNREAVIYVDDAGNTIAAAIGGIASRTIHKDMPGVDEDNVAERVEFHIPYAEEKTRVYFEHGGREIKIYNLLKNPSSHIYQGSANYRDLGPGYYALTMEGGLGGTPGDLSYDVNYSSYSYNFYNTKGQLIASMTPNGVETLNGSIPTSRNQLKYTTFYTYDFQGRLLSIDEPDAGVTRYKYRTDGQIRLSMNANQNDNRFSYTNYDKLGRPVESGEFIAQDVHSELFIFSNVTQEDLDNPSKFTTHKGITTDWIKTYYDRPVTIPSAFTSEYPLTQEFVHGAVSGTESETVQTWYSYDDQGRVTWFLQRYKGLYGNEDGYFLIEYTYDFFGNVTTVAYQPQTLYNPVSEAFWHFYEYDASQRLSRVHTDVYPKDHNKSDRYLHATYTYYKHGPLKRVVLADDLQGIDYTYTAQGWLKAINHPVRAYDPGEDGTNGVSEDAFGMTLEYFEGDYARQDANIGSVPLDEEAFPQQNNGNIRSMLFGELTAAEYEAQYKEAKAYNHEPEVTLAEPVTEPQNVYAEEVIYLEPGFDSNGQEIDVIIQKDQKTNEAVVTVNGGELYTYTYDEKYQLKEAIYSTDGGESTDNRYDVRVKSDDPAKGSYDANGNIQGIKRYGDDGSALLHDFEFDYYPNTNRLRSVDGYINLITYNDIGQVTGMDYFDEERRDFSVAYDVTGKVTSVSELGSGDPIIEFGYDDRGFRMMKRVHLDDKVIEEWYIRDASGQVMAIYHRDTETGPLAQIELPIYGASKLGTSYKNPDHYKYIYELTDHLGSVRAIVTKLGLQATASMEVDDEPNGVDEYEEQYFDNLPASRRLEMANSRSGKYSAYTHAGNPIGPTVTLQVKAGDEINLEVYAKYSDPGNPDIVGSGLADALSGSINFAAVGFEGTPSPSTLTDEIAAILTGATASSDQPKAYLQYILFDKYFGVLDDGYIPVEAGTEKNGWRQLTISDEVMQDGYLYAYVVNESNIDVYWDDFTFMVKGPRAIRKTDYYPFGAVAKVWNNPDQTQRETYRHGYQGQYAEQDTTTGWNAFELRMYDPLIGRWLQG